MEISKRTARTALVWVIAFYVVLAALYAVNTPIWQAPDEPAHFNYVAHLANELSFPVLSEGDYPHPYLEEIKAARFPPTMPITALRYESHQPPLYYLLAAPIYLAVRSLDLSSQVLGLRLFSIALGAAGLWVLYHMAEEALGGLAQPASADRATSASLAATAFAAVLPMHVAVTASVNNDVLAELVLLCILWRALRTIHRGFDLREAWATGLWVGLALLTKTTIYLPAAGVVGLAICLARPRYGGSLNSLRARVVYGAKALAVSLAVAAPWFLRNAVVYGNLDILGWQRHDAIVAGQLRTQDLLAQLGWQEFLTRFVRTTFRSFWGQFGWMGVLLDDRVYQAFAVLTAILALAFALAALRLWRDRAEMPTWQKRAFGLLAAAAGLTMITYIGYNLKFVQHQGRYLFPALGPLAVAVGLGALELCRPRVSSRLALLLCLVAAALGGLGAVSGDLPGWTLLLLLTATAWLTLAAWLPSHWRWLPLGSLYLGLLVLNPILIHRFLVPALSIASASP